MENDLKSEIARPPRNIKSFALPHEHGSWGFLLEPLVAGIFLAPATNTIWIVLLFIGAFLLRQPLRFLVPDLLEKKNLPRTAIAGKFVLLFGIIFVSGLIGTILFVNRLALTPFAFVVPFAIFQIYSDAKRQSRDLIPEIGGAAAIASSIAVLAIAKDESLVNGFALWLIMLARLIPSVLYVRSRLRLEKGKSFAKFPPIASHTFSCLILLALAWWKLAPWLIVLMSVVLLVRAVAGLSRFRKPAKAKWIGIWEVIYGGLFVAALVCGKNFGI
jgi:hypothetical protein